MYVRRVQFTGGVHVRGVQFTGNVEVCHLTANFFNVKRISLHTVNTH